MNKQDWSRYPVTYFLLLVTVCVFLWMQVVYFGRASQVQTIYEMGGMYGWAVRLDPSQLWRLVTPIVIHIDWEHTVFNSFALWTLGRQLEPLFGSRRFFLHYLLAGVMGNALVFFLTPDVVGVGASTSLFGLFASLLVLKYRSRQSYLRALGAAYAPLILLNIGLTFLAPSISIAGHLGGALGGVLLICCLPPQVEKDLFSARETVYALFAYLFLLILFVVLPYLV